MTFSMEPIFDDQTARELGNGYLQQILQASPLKPKTSSVDSRRKKKPLPAACIRIIDAPDEADHRAPRRDEASGESDGDACGTEEHAEGGRSGGNSSPKVVVKIQSQAAGRQRSRLAREKEPGDVASSLGLSYGGSTKKMRKHDFLNDQSVSTTSDADDSFVTVAQRQYHKTHNQTGFPNTSPGYRDRSNPKARADCDSTDPKVR